MHSYKAIVIQPVCGTGGSLFMLTTSHCGVCCSICLYSRPILYRRGNDRFLARDSIYAIARYMPSPVRPSVCLSVCHTGGSVKDG